MSEKKAQRKVLEQMMDSVTEGHAFTVYGRNGPLAMVIPWSDWQALNARLIEREHRRAPDVEAITAQVNRVAERVETERFQHLGASVREAP